MHCELKTIRFRCDNCGKEEIVQSPYFERPKGWTTGQLHDCGLTGYTRTTDLCPSCGKSEEKETKC